MILRYNCEVIVEITDANAALIIAPARPICADNKNTVIADKPEAMICAQDRSLKIFFVTVLRCCLSTIIARLCPNQDDAQFLDLHYKKQVSMKYDHLDAFVEPSKPKTHYSLGSNSHT